MKINTALLSTLIAATCWNPSNGRRDELNSAEPTQSPQPITNTLQSNGSEQDSLKNPPTGASVLLDEVNACDKYYSNDFKKISNRCTSQIQSEWYSKNKDIDLAEYKDSRITMQVAGGALTSIFLCKALPIIQVELDLGFYGEPGLASLILFTPALIGLGVVIAGHVQLKNADENFVAEFVEDMRTKLPSCIEEDAIQKGCVEINGSLDHGHLRG